jgi:molybdenum cofactor cytidylyltransferase
MTTSLVRNDACRCNEACEKASNPRWWQDHENGKLPAMTSFANLAAIMLAAGFSRRMGGENKLLKPLDGRPLIAHALATASGLGLGQLIVVLGDAADVIAPLLPASATAIRNRRAAEGMGASLASGAMALDPALAGAFVVLADMPFVTPGDYSKLAASFDAEGRDAICIPLHGRRRGHPVLFPARHFPDLAASQGDSGARRLLAEPSVRVCEVDGCSPGVLADFDDPSAFAAPARDAARTIR